MAAFVVRAAMLVDFLHSNPTAWSLSSDARVYWEAAGRIASGVWIDDKPFHYVPLYPYVLALVRLVGGNLLAVYVLQLILHLVTAFLIGHLAARKLGGTTGLVTVAFFLLLREPAFFANRVLPSTLQLLLVSFTLFAADRLSRHESKGRAAALGVSLGLLTLVYPPAMILVPLLVPWLYLRRQGARAAGLGTPLKKYVDPVWHRLPAGVNAGFNPVPHTFQRPVCPRGPASPGYTRLLHGLLAAAAGCAVILPATLHNWAACGEFIPITAHAGITLRQGNAPGSNGVYTRVEGVRPFREKMHRDAAAVYASSTGRRGNYREIDRFFRSWAFEYLASDPPRAAWLMGRKLYWFLTGRHYGDIYYPSLEQADGWINLSWLSPICTAWLMGPALAGLVIAGRKGRVNAADLALVTLPALIVMVFWFSPRYRLPGIPVLSLAAAVAVVEAGRAIQRGSRGWTTAGVVGSLVLASMATGRINVATGFDIAEAYRPQYEFNCGQVFTRLGDFETALKHFQRSDELAPGGPLLLAAMADSLTKLDRFEEARRMCMRLLEEHPDSTVGWLALGGLHLRLERWAEARAAFLEYLAVDPANPEAHLGMWLSLSALGRRGEGAVHLRQSVRLDPSDALASSEYGIYLAEEGQLLQAEQHLRRALRLSPDRPEVHFNLGEVLMQQGRTREALKCFREALKLDPDYDRARRRLNQAPGSAEVPPEAVSTLRKKIRERPNDGLLYSELAGTLYAGGDHAGAVAALREGLRRGDETVTLSLELGWLLSTSPDTAIRDGEEALRIVRTVRGRLGDEAPAEVFDVLAAALAETGRFDDALREGERGVATAVKAGQLDLARTIRRRIELYRARQPYRQ